MRLFAIGICLLLSFTTYCQAFEGRIEIEIEGLSHAQSLFSDPASPIIPHLLSDVTRQATLYIKDQQSKLVIEHQDGRRFSILSTRGAAHFYTILGPVDQPIVVKHTLKSDQTEQPRTEMMIQTNDSRMINGQLSRLFFLNLEDQALDLWMTTDFAYRITSKWPALSAFPFLSFVESQDGLSGFCMEIDGRNTKTNGHYHLQSKVVYQPLSSQFFELPNAPIDELAYSKLMQRYMNQIEDARTDPDRQAQLLLEMQILSGGQAIN